MKSSGPKPKLKSISNIVQNNKTNIASNVTSNRTTSKPPATLVTTRDTSTDSDRIVNQIVSKGLIKSADKMSLVSKEPVIFPVLRSTISTSQNGGCATKPLVINHSSSSDKSLNHQKGEVSMVSSLTATELILSSFVTAQTQSAATSAQATNRPASHLNLSAPTYKPFIVKSSAGKINARNEVSKDDDEFMDRQTFIRNKQPLANQQGITASNGPQAVTARLMDMGKRLLEASRQGHVDTVRQLVVNSGAPFTSDWLGTTALHLAAQNGHPEIAEILLRGGVNRDAKTKLERTALHLAAQGGNLEVVNLLLIHGSDVNARDMLKMSPLHWAVERGHVCVVEKLLLSGADVHAKSKFQLTPIDIALNSNSYEMMELFKLTTMKPIHSSLEIYCVKCWTHEGNHLDTFRSLHENLGDSHDILGVDHYHLSLGDHATTSRAPMLDIDEPCIDLVELEWNTLKFEPDFFLSHENEEDEPKVEYLMKIVEELQKENKQLRKRVEQLSTTCQ